MHTTSDFVEIIEENMSKIAIVREPEYNTFNAVSSVEKIAPRLVTVNIEVNIRTIGMELDTNAALSLITKDTYNSFKFPPLQPSETSLASFTVQPIYVLGSITIKVKFSEKYEQLPLMVVQ